MTLIYPMLAQIAWTFVVLLITANMRVTALKARSVRMGDIALGNSAWPDQVKAAGNNLTNQFETPVLFYALCGIATFIGATHWVMAALAWFFVVTRVAHTAIHLGGNNVTRRFQAFVLGVFALMGMWAVILVRLI